MQPSISVIIATKNERHNLSRLLESLATCSAQIHEVIVVDNFSADGTRSLARKIWGVLSARARRTLPLLTILRKGPERSAQRNAGSRKANGSHLLFLDADMEVSPSLLVELLRRARSHAQAAVIPEHALGTDLWGKAVALERNCYQNAPLLEAPRFIEKSTFIEVGGYDTTLIAGEDWDLSLRLKQEGISFKHTKEKLLHHEPAGFLPNLKRKWYYTKHIHRYAHKHPTHFAKQSSFTTRLGMFWAARRSLIRHPLHTGGFLLLKIIIYIRWKAGKHGI